MKKMILLADDDKDELNLISTILRLRGYEIIISENGKDLERTDLDKIDLFLLDINMKGIFGTDICRKLKNLNSTRNKPVILMSAAQDIRKKADDCGADNYLSKPFDLSQLMHVVQQHLAQ